MRPSATSAVDGALQQVMQQAQSAYNAGDWTAAERLSRVVLGGRANHFDALNLLGIITAQTQRGAQSAEWFARAVAVNAGSPMAHYNYGNLLSSIDRGDEAVTRFDHALALKPDFAEAWFSRGIALARQGRRDAALESYGRALSVRPRYAEALNNRGCLLSELQRTAEALECFDAALQVKPDYADAFNNRGNALTKLGRLEAALESFSLAIRVKADYAEAFNGRGNVLQIKGQFDAALNDFERASTLRPSYAEALNNRGSVLAKLRRFDEALLSFARALQANGRLADVHCNRGWALQELGRFEEALASYDQALEINPDFAEAWNNRAELLADLDRFDDASIAYERALRLKPDYEWLPGIWLHTLMQLCEWQDLGPRVTDLVARVMAGERVSSPFPLLALIDSLPVQQRAARLYAGAKYVALPAVFSDRRTPGGKIRIGYFSADFHDHATAQLMAEAFELHDRERFFLAAFSFGPERNDDMRKRLSAAFDEFVDVRFRSDAEIAQLARLMELDIAVDLKGYTHDDRPGIFALRAAPVQVSYLGYPGTTGAAALDYLIADAVVIPEASRDLYCEKIVYLPHSYQANDRTRRIADRVFSREELGLPAVGCVFCCFNANFKITPPTFDVWMRILQRVEGSVLWLLEGNRTAAVNLRREAQRRGIDPERLVFATRMPRAEHLARHRCADLFLDTLPYNAHTTASDALWVGLPVLTCAGTSFAARVAASLLRAMRMPELITSSLAEYEAAAVELAANPGTLAELTRRLAHLRSTTPLFDTPRFIRHLECAYVKVNERHRSGLPPDHIAIDP
jgi:predicted O-linked N-acetylglucosamine transferase (SPINDLY family)